MKPRVVCTGIAVLDRVYELTALPLTPGKVLARGYRETGGGMSATASVAVASLGGSAAWCGRLGADEVGAALLAALASHDVDTRAAMIAQDGRTPTSGVFVDPEGERILAVFPGAGLPDTPAFDATLLHGAGAVLADPRWVLGAERLFALATERHLPRVLDAETNVGDAIARLAPQADHVIFSQRGLVEFSGTTNPEAGLALATARLGGTLAVTLGAAGSLWWENGAPRHLPTPRVAARDTTGCGDVFHGAYALAMAEAMPVRQAARFATAAAALKAERGDGWNGMPDRAAVEALLQGDWS